MSNLTANDVNGLTGAYEAVYNPDLREELEEEREIQEVGIQIIENAAYVMFSQGYDVDDVISYFTEASQEVITEDAIAISEGVLLVENVAVSDEYIAEQFEILYEGVGSFLLKQGAKLAQGAGKALLGGGKKAEVLARAKNIQNIKNAKTTVPPGSAKVTTGAGGKPPTGTARVTTSGGGTVGRNLFQKAGDWAKGVMKKIPGAGTAAKLAKGPVGKIAGRALPGVGAALYGADAVSRAKKGDWGGAALSGAGAVTSLIPGAGLVAGLAPAAIQMATDAAGLTGDKSKKGPKKVGPKIVGPKIVGPKSQSPASPAPSRAPSASSAPTPPKPSATQKPAADTKLTPMQQWAKAHPGLASKVKVGQSGYDEISQTRTKPGPNEKQDQTPTQGPKTTPEQDKNFAQQAQADVKAQQERERKKLQQQQAQQPVTAKEAYSMLADYFMVTGQAESISEAYYILSCLGEESVNEMVIEMGDYLDEAAKDQSDKQIEKGVKTTYKAQNVIDNQHQGRSRGLNRLPAGERAAKSKRMSARLNARRDDLFQERGNREDEKREKLKKMLGL